MKKRMLTIVLVAVFILALSACGNNQDKTYSKEDFQSIVIGESTIKDVHKRCNECDIFWGRIRISDRKRRKNPHKFLWRRPCCRKH